MNKGRLRDATAKEESETKISGGKLYTPLPVENLSKLFVVFRCGLGIILCPGKKRFDPSMSPVTYTAWVGAS